MKANSKSRMTRADKVQALNAIRHTTDEQLEEALVDVLAVEQRCRLLVGIGPDDSVPFFVNHLADFWSTAILRELEIRSHSYVEQGSSVRESLA